MAGQNRSATAYLSELVTDPQRLFAHGFVPLLRYIDANSDSPYRLGYSISPKYDSCRFGQTPLLKFYPSAFTQVKLAAHIPAFKLKNSYFGLFGMYGPLPTHLTEYAIERNEQYKDFVLSEFADVFHHRFISLFYRAWADAEPVVSLDKIDDDRFGGFLRCLSGSTDVSAPVTDVLQQALTGLFSHKNKSKGALAQILSEFLQLPVFVEEFSGQWYPIENNELTRLGRSTAVLAKTAVAGRSSFQRAYCFTINIGPLDFEEYQRFFLQPSLFKQIRKHSVAFAGIEFDIRIALVLKPFQSKPTKLNHSRLGQTTWLQSSARNITQNKALVVYRN